MSKINFGRVLRIYNPLAIECRLVINLSQWVISFVPKGTAKSWRLS